MTDTEELQRILLSNLAIHADPARLQLCLSLSNAARLADLAPEAMTAIEQGKACMLSTPTLTDLTVILGLDQSGLPKPRHPGR